WFIKLFTEEGDWVLDPFMGSGTTIRVAQRLHRNSVGIELNKEYFDLVYKTTQPVILTLFETDSSDSEFKQKIKPFLLNN
ncbi:MAG: site-specific DNA-methyltransferase, partial [Calditrichaeota bacterium]|nr:site-specific DNA-methyltransferase [Calditrichota bacterium]